MRHPLILTVYIFAIMLTIGRLITELEPVVNDDAYVYYNYARNFLEGRLFAYDARSIPSEGFTSIIYMLALVPAEYLRINLVFTSVIINIVALISAVALFGWITYRTGLLASEWSLLASLLLLILFTYDENVRISLEWGLETFLGVLVVMLATVMLSLSLDRKRTTQRRSRTITLFFAICFTAYLIRPEYAVFLVSVGGLLLLLDRDIRRETILEGLLFALALLIYHLLKLAVFSDAFPTGFYRKAGIFDGGNYVAVWSIKYLPSLLLAALLFVLSLYTSSIARTRFLLSAKWIWFLIIVSIGLTAFFATTSPIVGFGFRYLITPIWVIYLLIVTSLVNIIQLVAPKLLTNFRVLFENHKQLLSTVLVLACTAFPMYSLIQNRHQLGERLNLYDRVVRDTEQHPYLRFGSYLRTHLPNPDAITLVFGDAGAVPYALGGRFIDTNGLTEPAIAHLFRLPDGEEKTQRFIDHVLGYNPDLIVLGYGNASDQGVWQTSVNPHSPFFEPMPVDVYKAYQSFGVVYVCSVRSYYDLHLGVWQDSPYFNPLVNTLREYCVTEGYVLPNGLTVEADGETVFFTAAEPLTPITLAP